MSITGAGLGQGGKGAGHQACQEVARNEEKRIQCVSSPPALCTFRAKETLRAQPFISDPMAPYASLGPLPGIGKIATQLVHVGATVSFPWPLSGSSEGSGSPWALILAPPGLTHFRVGSSFQV